MGAEKGERAQQIGGRLRLRAKGNKISGDFGTVRKYLMHSFFKMKKKVIQVKERMMKS